MGPFEVGRQAVGRLQMRAAKIAAAASDGVVGVRSQLKAAERDLLGSLATALATFRETGIGGSCSPPSPSWPAWRQQRPHPPPARKRRAKTPLNAAKSR
jgi:hypothetical protein